MENKNDKHEKFKRIAAKRTQKALDSLRLLGNCANTAVYNYSEEDIRKIFSAIDLEIKRIKGMYSKKKYNKFSL